MKIHFRHLHGPFCGRFVTNSGCIARCAPLVRIKSSANCDLLLTESSFQAHSKTQNGDEIWMRD
ncbi:DUF6783 domain-containing protein [Clostridium sp. MCC353]|uniref:DUF6783 domain-containing protein n=1 Tax=Clostridium sp. MCC353 TaxID=2592646 RepID=UPI0031FE5B49